MRRNLVAAVVCGVVTLAASPGCFRAAAPSRVMVFGDSIAAQVADVAGDAVIDAARPGERMAVEFATDGGPAGENRIAEALEAGRPDAVLVIAGANDLLEGVYRNEGDAWMDVALSAMHKIVEASRDAGAEVVVSTVAPQRLGGRKRRDFYAVHVPEFNERIRAAARQWGVPVVDAYAVISLDVSRFVSDDDLHLTPEGAAALWKAARSALRIQR